MLAIGVFVIGYFLIAFIVYATGDYAGWRLSVINTRTDWYDFQKTLRETRDRDGVDYALADHVPTLYVLRVRAAWDFLFPVIFAIYVGVVTAVAAWHRPVAKATPATPAATSPRTATPGSSDAPSSVSTKTGLDRSKKPTT